MHTDKAHKTEAQMTPLQVEVLNILQEGLPIVPNPFEEVARKLNVEETDVIHAVQALDESGLMRRFGGIVDINKLGVVSTLIGLQVESEKMHAVAMKLNENEGITHNYERDDTFNLWFTLMAESQASLKQQIEDIREFEGVTELIHLPARNKFKTKVIFKF